MCDLFALPPDVYIFIFFLYEKLTILFKNKSKETIFEDYFWFLFYEIFTKFFEDIF